MALAEASSPGAGAARWSKVSGGREPPPLRFRHAAGARGLPGASPQAGSGSYSVVFGAPAALLAEVSWAPPAFHL